jgi:phytoene dehydrogenase-like protein
VTRSSYDAVVVGAGPNGLAAAIAIAREGHSVAVLEAADSPGGGCRSAELTRPGFVHDVCSAINPLAAASPFFKELPLGRHGVELVHPALPAAHPIDGGRAAYMTRDVEETAESMGPDARRYSKLMRPWVRRAERVHDDFMRPIRIPKHPISTSLFGLRYGFRGVDSVAASFEGDEAPALLAGMAAHSMLALSAPPTGAMAIMFTMLGHAYGWPLVKGGAQKITDALVTHLLELGGEIHTGSEVRAVGDIPTSRVVLFDTTPRQLVAIAGEELPSRYVKSMSRFRYGPGVFKMDWALSDPVPWSAEPCRRAGTVHVGGTLAEVAASEAEVVAGRISEQPFVLVAQQSLFDRRAPDGNHTLWGYCHVPSGSDVDMTGRIEAQIERFAPGFKDTIINKHVMGPADMERYNSNYVGGDINGGLQNFRQFLGRPVLRWDPYSTPNERFFICSSSTPPGGGVHGMCGYNAAHAALKMLRGS